MELLVSETRFDSGSRWLFAHAVAVFAFLYLPIAVLILYSFNGEGVGGFPPHHLTLDWYRTLFADAPIWDSVLNSLEVAVAAMVISLTFGVPAALALERAEFPGKALFRRLVLLNQAQPYDDRFRTRDGVDFGGDDRSVRGAAEA
jgi:spermidine/putrescine transport system permease protein